MWSQKYIFFRVFIYLCVAVVAIAFHMMELLIQNVLKVVKITSSFQSYVCIWPQECAKHRYMNLDETTVSDASGLCIWCQYVDTWSEAMALCKTDLYFTPAAFILHNFILHVLFLKYFTVTGLPTDFL